MTWVEIVKWIWRKLVEAKTKPAGGVGASIELGSGYSTEAERMKNRAKLEAVLDAVIQDPELFQDEADKHTHCNIAFARIAEEMGYIFDRDAAGDLPVANEMIRIMLDDPDRWTLEDGARAAAHALKGGLAVAIKSASPHGHVAAIAPREMELSESLQREVPIVANVGRGPSKYCKVSAAFPVAEGEPRYLLLDVEAAA